MVGKRRQQTPSGKEEQVSCQTDGDSFFWQPWIGSHWVLQEYDNYQEGHVAFVDSCLPLNQGEERKDSAQETWQVQATHGQCNPTYRWHGDQWLERPSLDTAGSSTLLAWLKSLWLFPFSIPQEKAARCQLQNNRPTDCGNHETNLWNYISSMEKLLFRLGETVQEMPYGRWVLLWRPQIRLVKGLKKKVEVSQCSFVIVDIPLWPTGAPRYTKVNCEVAQELCQTVVAMSSWKILVKSEILFDNKVCFSAFLVDLWIATVRKNCTFETTTNRKWPIHTFCKIYWNIFTTYCLHRNCSDLFGLAGSDFVAEEFDPTAAHNRKRNGMEHVRLSELLKYEMSASAKDTSAEKPFRRSPK